MISKRKLLFFRSILDAIDVLQHPPDGDDVNIYFLYGFSSANALVC
jgi:hypothetical protein